MKIKNVITDGIITDQSLFNNLIKILEDIQLSNDPLKENYSFKRMDLLGHKSFDMMLTDDDDVICFSGLYHRNTWPEGFYRISNRTYVLPNHRTSTYNFINPSNIGPYQISKHKNSIKLVFISREKAKGRFYFKKLQKLVDYYKNWTISNDMVKLVDNNNSSSYQYIIYNSCDGESVNKFESISEQQWRKLL